MIRTSENINPVGIFHPHEEPQNITITQVYMAYFCGKPKNNTIVEVKKRTADRAQERTSMTESAYLPTFGEIERFGW